jgi:sec-independent protein translocase protein TatC
MSRQPTGGRDGQPPAGGAGRSPAGHDFEQPAGRRRIRPWLRRRGPSRFQRAADGSMTLIEHFLELRTRLFRASLAVVAGLLVGFAIMREVRLFLAEPYCEVLGEMGKLSADGCTFTQLGPLDVFLLDLKIALGVGLLLAAPVWLYQLWAFIAPGLHRRERKWAYVFAAIAAPLFAGGAVLAFLVLERALGFLLGLAGDEIVTQLEITRYVSFVVNMMVTAGFAFQFPLIVLMLNFTGVASARKLLSWWRVTVFIMFVLAALITPTPEPFTMAAIGLALSSLYFLAVGVAFLNDRRRARKAGLYGDLADDEISPLDEQVEPVTAGEPVEVPAAVPDPAPLHRRFDDMT